jgi:putative membrane protein
MKANRTWAWLLIAVTVALSSHAMAQTSRDSQVSQPSTDAGKTSMSKQDAKLLEELARANMAEVALGKLAEQKASSDDVRKFGKHMVDDHAKMLDQGGKIAKSKNVEPPTAPDNKQQASQKKLEGLSGEQFDRAFMEQMVKDHEQALKLVNRARQARDPELKAMAQEAAPEVEQHLKMARELSSKSGGARQRRTSNSKGN